jgi:fucose 4-O-acetylase-like acetyltransferase
MQLSPAEDAEAPRSQTDRTRQVWIDFARGIGVILVVYGHVLGGLIPPHLFPDGPLAQWMSYTLYTFHMPLFFFLAGLNVQHSLTRGARPFLASKAWTIAYPYVLWSLIQGSVIMLISRNANIPITASDLMAIWYRPMAQFWFLYALMICHVLAVLIPNRTIMIVVALAGLIVFMLLPIRPDLALTMHHLPFYVAGLYATRIVMAWQPHGRTGWTMLTVIATAFAAAVAVGGQLSGFDANGAIASGMYSRHHQRGAALQIAERDPASLAGARRRDVHDDLCAAHHGGIRNADHHADAARAANAVGLSPRRHRGRRDLAHGSPCRVTAAEPAGTTRACATAEAQTCTRSVCQPGSPVGLNSAGPRLLQGHRGILGRSDSLVVRTGHREDHPEQSRYLT